MKILFVVPRFGPELIGGAERYCSELVERLSKYHKVEIATTCAKDFMSWRNEFVEGCQIISGIKVYRFRVDFERNLGLFSRISRYAFRMPFHFRWLEYIWMRSQGPVSTFLLLWLKKHRKSYDIFIFIPYLYATTVICAPLVKNNYALIPALHDEPALKLRIFDKIFMQAKILFTLSKEEEILILRRFGKGVRCSYLGYGIDPKPIHSSVGFRSRYNLKERYILYAGRITNSKGCDVLFEYFIKYISMRADVHLVLIGSVIMDIPSNPLIHYVGSLSEEEKFMAISEATAVVIPSKYESLSITLLESFSCGVPVLANGASAVLDGHCKRSGAGIVYNGYKTFSDGLSTLIDNKDIRKQMGKAGKEYIRLNYSWDMVIERFHSAVGNLVT